MRRASRAALVACTAAAVLSCAGPPLVQDKWGTDRKDEIRAYFMQIREWRAEIGLKGVEPQYAVIQTVRGVPVGDLARMCELPAEPAGACNDICGIAEHICENAEAICRIADELENDRWADEKCASAKASCKEAKESCCDCEAKHGNADSAG